MKIILIHNYYQYRGGEDVYFDNLVRLLKQKGNQVVLYTKNSQKIKAGFFNQIEVALNLIWNFSVTKELQQILHQFKPDIVHIHNVYPLISPAVYFLCNNNHFPIVQTVHNYRFLCPKGFLFRNSKICEKCTSQTFPFWSIVFKCYHQSRLASLIFSISSFLYKKKGLLNTINLWIFPSRFTENYYQSNLSNKIINTAIVPYFYNQDKLKINKNIAKQFVYLGRLSEEKGISWLLDIFKSQPKFKLDVIGSGPLNQQLKARYVKCKNINFVGFLTQKSQLKHLSYAYGVIIPSLWYEVLPMVAIETSQYHIPIIVPNHGALKELSTDLPNCYMYNMGDSGSLIRLLTALSESKNNQTTQTIQKNKSYVRYDANDHYKRLIYEYRKIINNR